jgi:hypothetical protein
MGADKTLAGSIPRVGARLIHMNALPLVHASYPALFLPATLLMTGLAAWWVSVQMLRLGRGRIDPKRRRREDDRDRT